MVSQRKEPSRAREKAATKLSAPAMINLFMPLRVYCDQNFLSDVHNANPEYRHRICQLITDGQISLVISPYHWLETARIPNPENALARADFIDSLNPLWLRERRILQRHEVEACFFGWLGIPYGRPAPITSRAGLISDLSGAPMADTGELRSRDFVLELQSGSASAKTIREAYEGAAEAQQGNAKFLRRKRITDALKKQADREFVSRLLPAYTPAGLAVDGVTKDKFLDQLDLQECPSIAVEIAISNDRLKLPGLRWQTFVDLFHVISVLPYVDLLATNDTQLTKLVNRAKPSFRFAVACPISKECFDRLYLL